MVTRDNVVELTRGQEKNPPVGSGSAIGVAFVETVEPPWRLLIVTDGVWKYVGWQRLVAATRNYSGDALTGELQRAARLPGSGRFQDDFTVVLMEADAGWVTNNTLVPEESI